LVLSQSYAGGGRVVRIPTELKTIGDHIRRQRLALKMRQEDVAKILGVEHTSIRNWEGTTSTPESRYMPAIIELLGYNPLPPATGMG